MVVFILNTASPWIIPEKFTAPQHTRFILPLFHPTKSIAMLHGRYFSFTGNAPWKFHEPTGRDTDFSSTPLQNRGRNFVRSKRRPPYMSSTASTYFCALTIRKHLLKMCFERSGRRQEPSRGHKFSIFNSWKCSVHPGLHFCNAPAFPKWSCWGVPAPNPAHHSCLAARMERRVVLT